MVQELLLLGCLYDYADNRAITEVTDWNSMFIIPRVNLNTDHGLVIHRVEYICLVLSYTNLFSYIC